MEVDGHDHGQLTAALTKRDGEHDKPRCVIARTVKGKGVSFMENSVLWHYRIPRGEELRDAVSQLEVTA